MVAALSFFLSFFVFFFLPRLVHLLLFDCCDDEVDEDFRLRCGCSCGRCCCCFWNCCICCGLPGGSRTGRGSSGPSGLPTLGAGHAGSSWTRPQRHLPAVLKNGRAPLTVRVGLSRLVALRPLADLPQPIADARLVDTALAESVATPRHSQSEVLLHLVQRRPVDHLEFRGVDDEEFAVARRDREGVLVVHALAVGAVGQEARLAEVVRHVQVADGLERAHTALEVPLVRRAVARAARRASDAAPMDPVASALGVLVVGVAVAVQR